MDGVPHSTSRTSFVKLAEAPARILLLKAEGNRQAQEQGAERRPKAKKQRAHYGVGDTAFLAEVISALRCLDEHGQGKRGSPLVNGDDDNPGEHDEDEPERADHEDFQDLFLQTTRSHVYPFRSILKSVRWAPRLNPPTTTISRRAANMRAES